jgi:hypothetical protein
VRREEWGERVRTGERGGERVRTGGERVRTGEREGVGG